MTINRGRGPQQKPLGTPLQGGFTLIELLVVVFIVGVLAAAALPRYQTAVWKASAAELFVNVKAAREASGVYYMANGVRLTSWPELDVQIPYVRLYDDGGVNAWENGFLQTANGNEYVLDVEGFISGRTFKGGNSYLVLSSFYPQSANKNWARCRFLCGCPSDLKAAQLACLSLGGVYDRTLSYGQDIYCIQ